MEGGISAQWGANWGGQIEEATPRLRWLNGVLQQAWAIRGHDFIREEWRDVPSEQSPKVTGNP